MPGIRVQAFLLRAALLVKAEYLGLRQPVAIGCANSRRIESQFGENFIKIVPAKRADPLRGNNMLLALIEFNQGGIEGSASQVVDEDVALGVFRPRCAVSMSKLDARRGRFVQKPHNLKTGLPKRLGRQKSLIAVGVRRDPQHHFELACLPRRQVRVLEQIRSQGRA